MNIPSRGSKEERIRIPCGYGLIYRVTDIINKTKLGKYVSVRVRYRVTWHASAALAEGGSGAVGARGEPGVGGGSGSGRGSPYNHPPSRRASTRCGRE